MSSTPTEWETLGAVKPAELVRARVEAHQAVQVIAAAGETHLPHAPDTSHTAATWSKRHRAFLGAATAAPHALRVGLRLEDLSLLVVGAEGDVVDTLPLPGQTLAAGQAWAAEALARRSGGALAGPLSHPGFELPPDPLAEGAAFAPPDAGLTELARWFANADAALRAFAERTPGAGPVLTWPHHFDMATLVTVESGPSGEATKTLGVGLSPGDGAIAEPYWYVNHWPGREVPGFPELAAGRWHTAGFTAAVLDAGALVAAGGGAEQARCLETFLGSAVEATRKILSGRS